MGMYKTKKCECGDANCVPRTAADYSLEEVPVEIRMLALLHAVGRDVSTYFERPLLDGGKHSVLHVPEFAE